VPRTAASVAATAGPALAAATIATRVLAAPRGAHAGPPTPWWNVGVSEVVLLPEPQHYAAYGYVAVTLPIPTGWHELYVIPGLGFEVAPEVSRGGGLAALTFERMLGTRVAGDLIVSLVHDQERLDFDGALFSLGLGAGVSIAVGDFSLSPSCYVYRVLGSPDWSFAPTLNLAHLL
jgi:hypothetical protein